MPANAIWKQDSKTSVPVSERNRVSPCKVCINVPQFLRALKHECASVTLSVCMRACVFIIQLIVYGSCFLWRNKLKLLNPFAAYNAISQGYPEWVKDAPGTTDLSDETSALWVTVCLLWFFSCMYRNDRWDIFNSPLPQFTLPNANSHLFASTHTFALTLYTVVGTLCHSLRCKLESVNGTKKVWTLSLRFPNVLWWKRKGQPVWSFK